MTVEAAMAAKAADSIYFIGIDYEEFKQDTYRSVTVRFTADNGKEVTRVFDSGDPVVDYAQATNFACVGDNEVYFSSSVDDFILDGSKYGIDDRHLALNVL